MKVKDPEIENELLFDLYEINIIQDEIDNLYYYLEFEENSEKRVKILKEISELEKKLEIFWNTEDS